MENKHATQIIAVYEAVQLPQPKPRRNAKVYNHINVYHNDEFRPDSQHYNEIISFTITMQNV
jgi:hypothetical protein